MPSPPLRETDRPRKKARIGSADEQIRESPGTSQSAESYPNNESHVRTRMTTRSSTASPASSDTDPNRQTHERLEDKVKNLNVLIVDDHSASRKILKRLVETRGVTAISEACDGTEAMKALKTAEKSIDLVLMDVDMPKMDGITAVNKLRKVVPKKQWPYVAMVTVKDTASDIQDCNKRCSPNQYMTKPVRQVDLAICLQEAVAFSSGEKGKGGGKPAA